MIAFHYSFYKAAPEEEFSISQNMGHRMHTANESGLTKLSRRVGTEELKPHSIDPIVSGRLINAKSLYVMIITRCNEVAVSSKPEKVLADKTWRSESRCSRGSRVMPSAPTLTLRARALAMDLSQVASLQPLTSYGRAVAAASPKKVPMPAKPEKCYRVQG